jgi:hypothetical protein
MIFLGRRVRSGHSKEQFSEPTLLLKIHSYGLKTVHTYEWFYKPFIHSMIIKVKNKMLPKRGSSGLLT